MFTDSVMLTLTAGAGGNGVVAWRREKYIPKGGPAGGDGGNGGDVYIQADRTLLSLEHLRYSRQLKAESGASGGSALKQGRRGTPLVFKVPCGTLIKDAETKEVLLDLKTHGQKERLCKGGRGGKGNARFRSPTHQAPNICTPGTPGETRGIDLELKLIADIGLIGMPNAGKSTLLKKMTHAPVKIGAYPFTTLAPNLGYLRFDDTSHLLIADIPGIIENAHKDKGLGLSFLRHVERTSALIFVIDVSGFEGRDPIDDFRVLQNELREYRSDLLDKPFLVVLNKIDIEGAEEHIANFRKQYPYPQETLFTLSALNNEGLPELIEQMKNTLLVTQGV